MRWKLRLAVYSGLAGLPLLATCGWWLRYGAMAPAGCCDQGDNGLWMRRHWIHGGGDSDPQALVPALRTLGIRRLYPFLGPMDSQGWPGWRDGKNIRRYEPQRAAAFFAELEALDPELRVLPWTGGVLRRDVRPQDEVQRAAYAGHLAGLCAAGAAGVHINVEPLPPWEPGYLDLLAEVKAAIGPKKLLSVAAYPPPSVLHPYDEVHWDLDFAQQVCRVADELVFMAYDTGLRFAPLYEAQVAHWTRELTSALPPPEEGGCQWSMGLSAYEDDEPWHDPDVETMAHSLRGLLRGLAPLEVPAHFTGVAVYASWTTDAAEWASYERLWRGRQPSGVVVPDGG